MKPKCHIYRRLALASALVLSISAASASTYYWNNSGGGSWATGTNWYGGSGPSATDTTDIAQFNYTGVNSAETVTLNASESIGGLTFANTGTTLIDSSTTTPEALTIGTSGITINSGAGAVTIGNTTDPVTVTMGGAQSWTNNSSNTFTEVGAVTNGGYLLTVAGGTTIDGAITGTGGLTLTGTGTLSLYGANSIGNVTISSGTIFTENNNTFGNLSLTGTLDLGASAAAYTTTINGLSGSGSITTANSGGYARTLSVGNGNATSTFSGTITQAGNRSLVLDKAGNGTLTLGGSTSNVQGGGGGSFTTNVQAGTLILGMTNAVALPGNVTVSGGATLQLAGTGGTQIASTATVGISSGGVFDLDGQSDTTSTVSLAGTGISGGALINSLASTTSTLTAPVSLTAATTVGGAGSITVNGAISGGYGLTYGGTGTLTLSGTNTYTGATSVSSGTLSVTGAIGSGGGSAVSTSGTGALTVSGVNGLTGTSSLTVGTGTTATLQAADNNSGATSVTGTLNLQDPNAVASSAVTLNNGATLQLRNNSTTSFNSSGVVTLQGAASDNCYIDVNNNGSGSGNTLTLVNGIKWTGPGSGDLANTYTTTVNVTGGNGYTLALPTVSFTDGASYGSGGTRAYVLDFNPTTANVSLGNVTLSATGTRVSASLTLGGSATGNMVTGVIATSGTGVTVNGGGTWTFTGANTYTGTTTISSGTQLQIGNGGTTGSLSTSSSISDSGTLVFDRSNTVTEGTDFANAIGGGGAVTQAGSGSLVLGGTNTYTGATTISAGTLQVNGSTAAGSAVSVSSGATLSGSGTVHGTTSVTSGTVSGSGLTLTGVTTFNGTGNTLSGTETATAGVTLAAGATVTQNGTLTGNLNTTNTGTFIANGTVTGTATVASGGTLAGTGSIGGNTTIQSNGNLAPTAGSALTLNGGLNLSSGSIFDWNITEGSNVTAGTNQGSYGQLSVGGSVSGSAVFAIVLGGSNTFSDAFWRVNEQWTNIFQGSSGSSLASLMNAPTFGGAVNSAGDASGGLGYFTFNGSTDTLSWTATPEPTSALAGLLIGAGLLRRRRN